MYGDTPALAIVFGFVLLMIISGVANAKDSGGDAACRELFVASNGSDEWSGTLSEPVSGGKDGPFATLEKARDAIREMKESGSLPEGGVTVSVRGGTYNFPRSFILNARDSGSRNAPITYRAYKGEKVTLTGGRQVTGFRPYKGGILQADLASIGIGPFRKNPSMGWSDPKYPATELFFDGERQEMARWPNRDKEDPRGGGWAYVAGVPENSADAFSYSGDRPKNWKSPQDAQVNIWPDYNWADNFVSVASIDVGKREIILADKTSWPIKAGRRYSVVNVFEELDAPGEWYIDRRSNTLYFWPPSPIDEGQATLSVAESVIKLNNAAYVTLRDFRIEASRGTAVVISGGSNDLVAGCSIRGVGGYGVAISGTDNGILSSEIYETGQGGVILDGGNRQTLGPGRNFAENNHIHHIGRIIKCYQAGVKVSGVGNRIAHNLIHDAPHNAILLSGNEHLIEFNEIHHVCMEGADSGAFYMGRDWSMQGNVIRYNNFHDIAGYGLQNPESAQGPWKYEAPHAAWAIYLDDCSSGTTVFGNLFYRVPLAAVMIGGGRDNTVENNIIVESSPAVHLDARWDGYEHYYTTQLQGLEAVHYKEPPYSEKYPNLLKIYDGDPRLPVGNKIVRNIISYPDDTYRGFWNMDRGRNKAILWHFENYDEKSLTVDDNLIWHSDKTVRIDANSYKKGGGIKAFAAWQRLGFDTKSRIADPLFVDPSQDDYRLRDDSPAYDMGFQNIPIDKMGLYVDEFRPSIIPKDSRKDGNTPVLSVVNKPQL